MLNHGSAISIRQDAARHSFHVYETFTQRGEWNEIVCRLILPIDSVVPQHFALGSAATDLLSLAGRKRKRHQVNQENRQL